jgi:hypothetical protein
MRATFRPLAPVRRGAKPSEATPSEARGLGASEERSAAKPREHRTGPQES